MLDPLTRATLPQLVSRADVAKLLGVDISTLDRWARKGEGPQPLKLGGQTVRYDLADVAVYLSERKGA